LCLFLLLSELEFEGLQAVELGDEGALVERERSELATVVDLENGILGNGGHILVENTEHLLQHDLGAGLAIKREADVVVPVEDYHLAVDRNKRDLVVIRAVGLGGLSLTLIRQGRFLKQQLPGIFPIGHDSPETLLGPQFPVFGAFLDLKEAEGP